MLIVMDERKQLVYNCMQFAVIDICLTCTLVFLEILSLINSQRFIIVHGDCRNFQAGI